MQAVQMPEIDAPFPPSRHALLDSFTEQALALGHHLQQGHRLAPTDAGHVAKLLDLMAPPHRSCIADLGCGTGEMARLARGMRPDLSFVLVNPNRTQLAHAPAGEGFQRVRGDAHFLPLADACVDGAVFTYTLCHLDVAVALREAARITRLGGFLFVYDLERISGDDRGPELHSAARFHPRERIGHLAMAAGWGQGRVLNPPTSDAFLRQQFAGVPDLYEQIWGGTLPVIYRMIRTDRRPHGVESGYLCALPESFAAM